MIKKIIYPTLLGTTAMTIFSYLVSRRKHKDFKEPNVLAQFIKRLPVKVNEEEAAAEGFAAHYLAGLLFVLAYMYLWEKQEVEPNIVTGVAMGAAAGLVGIAGWELMFRLHPSPPPKNKKKYYGHLFLAHIVFGVFATWGYRLAKDNRQ